MPAAAPDAVEFARTQLGFEPDGNQAWMLAGEHHRLLVNCTRQWGKSTTSAIKALHVLMRTPGAEVVVLSPIARQSGEFLRKVATFVDQLGMKIRGDGHNPMSLELPNRSRVVGLPGSSGDRVRGFSNLKLLVLDEAARLKDETYRAARPMLAASRGDLWAVSTPLGKRGFFYENWSRADGEWERLTVKATDCARIPAEFLEEERRELGDEWVRQEYLCEFVDVDGAVFRREIVDRAFDDGLEVLVVGS
ncbi:MAG: terminase family protein [Acidobacteria bacterium]|nr:terminase family protein [Acidobacteriota bacterium]